MKDLLLRLSPLKEPPRQNPYSYESHLADPFQRDQGWSEGQPRVFLDRAFDMIQAKNPFRPNLGYPTSEPITQTCPASLPGLASDCLQQRKRRQSQGVLTY